MRSSSVGITRTITRLVADEITPSLAAFRGSSNSMPRKANPAQTRCRIGGAFSPIPPENTNVSNPPIAAAKAPIHFLT
jgi:hypothetical protein